MTMMQNALEKLDFRTGAVCFAALLGAVYLLSPSKKKKLPPGPPFTLPLLGNAYHLLTMKKRAYETFLEWTKTEKWGAKIYYLTVGRLNFVVLSDPATIKEALVEKAADFSGRPHLPSIARLLDNGKDILMAQPNKTWRFHRKIALQAIRNYAMGSRLEELIHTLGDEFHTMMKKLEGKPFDIKPYINWVNFNILTGTIMNKYYTMDSKEYQELKSLTVDATEALGNGLPEDFHPALAWIPFSGRRKLDAIMQKFIAFMADSVKEHKENYKPGEEKDFLDHLFKVQAEVDAEESDLVKTLTDENVALMAFDFFGAGNDTVGTTLHSTVGFMVGNVDKQNKVQAEIDDILGALTQLIPAWNFLTGSVRPGLQSKGKLPYTDAAMLETMRLGTVAALGVPLATTGDTTLCGYDIPKDTMVIVNIWAMHHDPDLWEQPNEFIPERFMEADGTLSRDRTNKAFMPFGAGRRICLGETLARSMLSMLVPMLFQRYEFRAAKEPFKLEYEDSSLALLPKPFDVIVKCRDR